MIWRVRQPTYGPAVFGFSRSGLAALFITVAGSTLAPVRVDATPPAVTVLSPNGGQSWPGEGLQTVTWVATDDDGVSSIDLFYRESDAAAWTMIARGLSNSGSFSWGVHHTPTGQARVRVVARDALNNLGEDISNNVFAITAVSGRIPTTLRDFRMPGTQPFGLIGFTRSSNCQTCHGGYDTAAEPAHAWKGSMMAQAGRDPLFYACLAIANQDAPSSGDMCIRCHSPFGWVEGRSQPTDGSSLIAADRDGVSCDHCHRMVDPVYQPGVSPPEDLAVLSALPPADLPTGYSNGQYVIDTNNRKRGPYTDATTSPHPRLAAAFTRSSALCGTCHDVSNPVYERVADDDYAPGPFDDEPGSVQSSVHQPIERTYSEWTASSFPAGVYAPEFAGALPSGIVSTCQDCHMADVVGKGCNNVNAPTRNDLGFHDFTGGNAWMPGVIAGLYPGEVDAVALAAAATRARAMLAKAAVLDIELSVVGGGLTATVTVTNRTGHKLPTGYPEGRRMWIHLVAYNGVGAIIYESGAYNAATGVLTHDPAARIYEIELGLTSPIAALAGLLPGPSFHFVLNDTIYKDNRIPPAGFTNAAFLAFGARPVESGHPMPRYPDGQNWDSGVYALPLATRKVVATLRYQSTSKEYVEFLRDENSTNNAGQTLYDSWVASGRAAPVNMAADSVVIGTSDVVADRLNAADAEVRLAPLANPFRGKLGLALELPGPSEVSWIIVDVQGRRISEGYAGLLGGGAHLLAWDGHRKDGADAPPGLYWARVRVGRVMRTVRLVKLP
ncbi:MAG: hypothetical protein SGI90_12925 [Candidatus Eisenbacteria bacterium]|nr:hypothetical protein [Candidatus Eisenbacteria bacterium]